MNYFVYLARCADRSLYTGATRNLKNRESKHNAGEGSNYTKKRRPIKIVYFEKFEKLSEALKRERQIKGWTRIKKENLIKFGHPNINKISDRIQ